MKIHITDENGDFTQTIEVSHTVVVEIRGSQFFELDCPPSEGKVQLQVWGGRRPWTDSSKKVTLQNQWKGFSIEPGAANVIRLALRD